MKLIRCIVASAILVLIIISASSVSGSQGRKLMMLLVGDIYPSPAVLLCSIDPRYDSTQIATREILPDVAQRYVRLYFPRTREMLNDYAMLLFIDADMSPFSGQQVDAMVDSVAQGHCGTFWTFGPYYDTVASSNLQRLVPHDMSKAFNQGELKTYTVSFRRERPPVFTPFVDLGLEHVRGIGSGQLSPRAGTTVWGDMKPTEWPWVVSWVYGDGGLSWAAADDLDHSWWWERGGFCENDYSVDVLANIISYTAGVELPGDIMLPILIRRELLDYRSAKGLYVSTLEFVEKFGADTADLYGELLRVDEEIVKNGEALYLDSEYEEALLQIRVGNQEIAQLVEKALKARERALLWVFLVEWLAVSGTSMLSGYVLWTLMVGRKMYREAQETRLTPRSR